MYHYVRDYENTSHKGIKGIDIREFEYQLNYLNNNFNILTPNEVKDKIYMSLPFNNKDCWLTFDDGYIDHYFFVRPILKKYSIKASFFPPVKTTKHDDVLDVNKIHFILSNVIDTKKILQEINNLYKGFCSQQDVDFSILLSSIDIKARFDDPITIKIKKLLQTILPFEIRIKICDHLFTKYVTKDKSDFAAQLYMSESMLQDMYNEGHEIGSHGVDHLWLSTLNKKQQEQEISGSVNFLKKLGILSNNWSMCFPYGDYNFTTINLLQKYSCFLGLTTIPKQVIGENYDQLILPRLDTNDFPPKSIKSNQ